MHSVTHKPSSLIPISGNNVLWFSHQNPLSTLMNQAAGHDPALTVLDSWDGKCTVCIECQRMARLEQNTAAQAPITGLGRGQRCCFPFRRPRTQLLDKNPNDGGKTVSLTDPRQKEKGHQGTGPPSWLRSSKVRMELLEGKARGGGRPDDRGQGSVEVGLP